MKKLWTLLAILLISVGVWRYSRPVPEATALISLPPAPTTTAIDLPWPAAGQSALGAKDYGLLSTHNPQQPAPIGSIAKVITALAVLQKKPISGDQGETLVLTDNDVALFNKYYSQDGSVAQVAVGERITEYQALQAMMLPSANNMADTMAIWAFGSIGNYVTYANKMVRNLGLDQTSVGDASGFADSTTSTSADLVKLGIAAISDPSIASIVGQTSAVLPVAGTVNNVNWLLGQDGVFGIKTGNTEKAGGCYLFAAKRQIGGQQIQLVGAVLGAPELNQAISSADSLLKASDANFQPVTVIHKGQKLATYITPWGSQAEVSARQDLSLLVWKGSAVRILNGPTDLQPPASAGYRTGAITANDGEKSASVPLFLKQDIKGPSWYWRLARR